MLEATITIKARNLLIELRDLFLNTRQLLGKSTAEADWLNAVGAAGLIIGF